MLGLYTLISELKKNPENDVFNYIYISISELTAILILVARHQLCMCKYTHIADV